MTNKNIIGIALIVLVVLIGVIVLKRGNDLPKDLGDWQAVFLSDGQVYFGHLGKYNNRFYKLDNVYYLKYGSTLQQEKTQNQTDGSQNLNLIKLGKEIHGPDGFMYIPKSQVLFIESLKNSSPVIQAINKNI